MVLNFHWEKEGYLKRLGVLRDALRPQKTLFISHCGSLPASFPSNWSPMASYMKCHS